MDLIYSTIGFLFPLQPWISSIQPLDSFSRFSYGFHIFNHWFFPLQPWISSIQPLVSFSRFKHGFHLFNQWFLFPASAMDLTFGDTRPSSIPDGFPDYSMTFSFA
jgi:hypothetical protein